MGELKERGTGKNLPFSPFKFEVTERFLLPFFFFFFLKVHFEAAFYSANGLDACHNYAVPLG